jgi:Ser/Thr protein kinase RdoA (MazF antagonist)
MNEERTRRLRSLAERALRSWDVGPATVELVSQSENTVYRVTARDGRRYALRIHRPGYHTLAELECEQRWADALTAAGIGVPRAVRTRAGTGYATAAFADPEETRHVGLIEWIEGARLAAFIEDATDDASAVARFRQLGALAARIHNQATAWPLPAGFVRHALDADGLMGKAPFWGPFWEFPELDARQRALAHAVRESLHAALVEYGTDARTFSLIHADLHPNNVLVDGDRLTIIDFDDAGFGWHAYELAVALFSYQPDPRFPRFRAALIDGYRSERALDDDTVARLPMFLTIRAWAVLGWLLGRPEIDRSAFVPRFIAAACRQAEAWLSR